MSREVLARALGRWSVRAEPVARALDEAGVPLSALEASVRGGHGHASGDRMMVEHLDTDTARAVLDALSVPLPALCDRLLDVSRRAGVPIIVGWDASSDRLVAKVYANASDASLELRATLARALLPPGARETAPHLIGLNFDGETSELKLYEQSLSLPADAPAALAAWASGLVIAGAVRSVVVDARGERVAKAWFVAPAQPDPSLGERLRRLPGFAQTIEARAPFAPGTIKSVGFSSDGRTWTVYFKANGHDPALVRLDPAVCVSDGVSEVGIHVEPTELAARAYVRTREHAIAYRIRSGTPDEARLSLLMQWVAGCVEVSERLGTPPDFAHPPEPWHVVASR